jgi:hypothetical protein
MTQPCRATTRTRTNSTPPRPEAPDQPQIVVSTSSQKATTEIPREDHWRTQFPRHGDRRIVPLGVGGALPPSPRIRVRDSRQTYPLAPEFAARIVSNRIIHMGVTQSIRQQNSRSMAQEIFRDPPVLLKRSEFFGGGAAFSETGPFFLSRSEFFGREQGRRIATSKKTLVSLTNFHHCRLTKPTAPLLSTFYPQGD